MAGRETDMAGRVIDDGKVLENVAPESDYMPEYTFEPDYHRSSNPVARFFQWMASWMIPGLGMFSEAYFIFSVGNLKSLFQVEYPRCWKTNELCSSSLLDSVSYSQIAGIIAGMLVLGFFADRIGRRVGSITTASIMLIGGILLTASDGPTSYGVFLMYVISQAIFGFGVGGEYPVASTSASERAESSSTLVNRRGETVIMVFSMQGVGNWVNTAIILICLAAWNQYNPPYNASSLQGVWRTSTGLGLVPIICMLFWRVFKLKESSIWKAKREQLRREGVTTSVNWLKVQAFVGMYWPRLIGTGIGWFVWDFAFYGNKLFQGTFIKIIHPNGGLVSLLEYTLLNSSVALVGYWAAAATVDRSWMGRVRMQIMGFTWMFVLFLCSAVAYNKLTEPANIHAFQVLYYLSSFWGQFGPNATTWLLASEVYPTEMRAVGHGISAATGKVGALVAGFVFGAVSNQAKFYISAACGLVGLLVTLLFVPDLTGMDLVEGDRFWLHAIEGRSEKYHGHAVNPKHLSMWERFVSHRGRNYDPAVGRIEREERKAAAPA